MLKNLNGINNKNLILEPKKKNKDSKKKWKKDK